MTGTVRQQLDQLIASGRMAEARMLGMSQVQQHPGDTEAWIRLSTIHRRLGRPADAEANGREAVRLLPENPSAHLSLALALLVQGRQEEALSALNRAEGLQPPTPEVHYHLGNLHFGQGRIDRAEQCYRAAIALRPDYFEALNNLGGLLTGAKRHDEAGEVLRRALAVQPGAPSVLTNLACAAEEQARFENAIQLYRQALTSRPQAIEVLSRLAGLLERMGRIEEAMNYLEQGMRISPRHPLMALTAARLARRENRDADGIRALEGADQRLAEPAVLGEMRVLLGQLHDRQGNTVRAFPLFTQGKRLLAQANGVSLAGPNPYLREIAAARRQLAPELAPAPQRGEPSGDDPVFLVGFPRSGTTLLEQILDAHPALQAMEEKPAADRLVEAFVELGGDAGTLARLDAGQIQRLRTIYFSEVARHLNRRPGTRLIDKMPLNLLHVPLLWRVFPGARFILALRHPCDVCLSCFMQTFSLNVAMASFFTIDSAARTYAAVMDFWLEIERTLPIPVHRIRYEDLVDDKEREARALIEFLGVGWNEAVLDHVAHAQQRTVINTPSYHQVTQPIYRHARYRWKRYSTELAPVMPLLQPFIEQFRYLDAQPNE